MKQVTGFVRFSAALALFVLSFGCNVADGIEDIVQRGDDDPHTVPTNPPDCTDVYVYGLMVAVAVDGKTSEEACDLTAVTVTDANGFEEQAVAEPNGSGGGSFPRPQCNYYAAGERQGTYTITVSAEGYDDQTVSDIVVTGNDCHVQTTGVSVDFL